MGGLLNQAVTVLNSTGQPPVYLADAARRCREVIDDVENETSAVARLLGIADRRRRRHTQRSGDHGLR